MTQLTYAPPLEHLTDLTTGWRHVCTALSSDREWCGELADDRARVTYQRMVERGQIITVQHRLGPWHYRVFAKMAAVREARSFTGSQAARWK